ncbi:MAG: urease accessory protein UreD, partial [Pseudomonadota bacterium]
IARDGVPIYADIARLDCDIEAKLNSFAHLGGHRIFATLVHVPGESDRESNGRTVDAMRASLLDQEQISFGVSAFETRIVCRVLAASMPDFRSALVKLLATIDDGLRLPQIWRL